VREHMEGKDAVNLPDTSERISSDVVDYAVEDLGSTIAVHENTQHAGRESAAYRFRCLARVLEEASTLGCSAGYERRRCVGQIDDRKEACEGDQASGRR
jgi:hypothetical protein